MRNPSPPRIIVQSLQRKIPVNIGELENFAATAVQRCLIFLQRKFLGHAEPTDVLTFQHGEIFVSVETAQRHARAFGNSLMRELKLYIVHGLLHLHGFDDQSPAEARRMKTAQEKILGCALS